MRRRTGGVEEREHASSARGVEKKKKKNDPPLFLSLPSPHLRARPTPLPVPRLDRHVIRRRQQQRKGRVGRHRPDVVGVRLPRPLPGERVHVEDPDVAVIGPRNDPLAAGDKGRRPDGQVRHLPRFQEGAVNGGVDADGAVVQVDEEPGVRRGGRGAGRRNGKGRARNDEVERGAGMEKKTRRGREPSLLSFLSLSLTRAPSGGGRRPSPGRTAG